MNFNELLIFILDLIIVYFSLFIEIFSPVITNIFIINNGYNILIISIILDIFLFFLGIIISKNKKISIEIENILITDNKIKKYNLNKVFNDVIILNIVFRFFPIISHIGNFISGYNKKINKIKGFFTLIIGYIFIYFISEFIISKNLWKIFNPTYSTSGNDMGYYFGIISFIFGIFILFIYINLKKLMNKFNFGNRFF